MSARRILTLAACGWIGTAPAAGSPRSDPTTGRAVFTGATSPSATSITLNPAALGVGPTGELLIAVTSVIDRLSIDRGDAAPPGTDASATATTLAPGMQLGLMFRTGERFTVGVDARTPPSENFIEGQESLRYHTLGGRQRVYTGSIAASFRVTSALFVGASLSHDNTLLHLKYARDLGSTQDAADAERYDIHARSAWLSTSNLRVNIGFVAQVMRDVWVAAAYHTPTGNGIESTLEGDVEVQLAPRDNSTVLHGQASVLVSLPASVDTELRARLPRALDLRIGGRWEDLSRFRAYDVRTFKRAFPAYNIPEWTRRARGLDDSFALWGGVEQVDLGQPLRFGARVGFETSSVPADKTSPLTMAPTSLTVDVGGALRLGGSWMLQLSYGIQVAPAVSVTSSAYDPQFLADCIAAGYDYTTAACAAAREGYAIPSAAGEYSRFQQAFRLALRYELP